MDAYSNVVELTIDNHGEKVTKRIHFDMFNDEKDVLSVFTPDGKRIRREDIGTYDPAEYHINVAKVLEKYYVNKKALNELESVVAVLYFTKEDDVYKIASNNEMLLELLKERKRVLDDPKIIKHYIQIFEIGQNKDFEW